MPFIGSVLWSPTAWDVMLASWALVLVTLFILRPVVTWYFRINRMLAVLEHIDAQLSALERLTYERK